MREEADRTVLCQMAGCDACWVSVNITTPADRTVLCQMAGCDACWVSVNITTPTLGGIACCVVGIIDDKTPSFLMAETGVF